MFSFDYLPVLSGGSVKIDGTEITAGGSFRKKLEAGESVAVRIESNAANSTATTIAISNIKLIVEQDVTITFNAPANGSYTLNGESITTKTQKTIKTTDVVELSATPASNHKLLGWYNVVTNECLSTAATTSLSFAEDTTVEPRFVANTVP